MGESITKILSVVTPCYNEEANVKEIYQRVKAVIAGLGEYRYEHIFIDNASRDRTLAALKAIAAQDSNVRVISNSRNFGHLRSPVHAMLQASGDAVLLIAADLQEPPELLAQMVRKWEEGSPVVIGVKTASDERRLMYWIRTRFYRLIQRLSELETYEHFTGFGLYDRKVMEIVRQINDPYPYFRGIIAEIGLPHVELEFTQARRQRGKSHNNFYTLYDLAMLGITNLSKVPLRLVTFAGFMCSMLSALVALAYLAYKLLFWSRFTVGMAPVIIGLFFFASMQMMFLGIIGEYIGAVHTLVQQRPLVFERERINFQYPPGAPQCTDNTVAGHVAG